MSRRTQRVGELLQIELADLLLRKAQDPRIHDCTITTVIVTPDLSHARVGISALGEEADRLAAIDALTHAKGFLRSQLAHRLRHMKRIPELHFELDRGAEHSQNISDLLEGLRRDDRS